MVLIPFIVSHIVDESISSLVGKRLWEQLEKAERLLRLKSGPALFGDLAIVLRTALFAGTSFVFLGVALAWSVFIFRLDIELLGGASWNVSFNKVHVWSVLALLLFMRDMSLAASWLYGF